MSKKGRFPTQDELNLWASVTDDLEWRRYDPRNSLEAQLPSLSGGVSPPSKNKQQTKPVSSRLKVPIAQGGKDAPKPLVAEEQVLGQRRQRRKIGRQQDLSAVLDLHHQTQAEARLSLQRFLQAAQIKGERVVLVITGKGRRRSEHQGAYEPGILQRSVPLWLSEPDMRHLVVGFAAAHQHHGGSGALYVRIRRHKKTGHD